MLEKKQANIDTNQQNQFVLKAEIESLQKELELIEQETNAFEALLRSKLAEELIEVQELRILYKKSKQLKKEEKAYDLLKKKREKIESQIKTKNKKLKEKQDQLKKQIDAKNKKLKSISKKPSGKKLTKKSTQKKISKKN